MDAQDQIECGNCHSKYYPRIDAAVASFAGALKKDCSCPVCGYGQVKESLAPAKKRTFLHD